MTRRLLLLAVLACAACKVSQPPMLLKEWDASLPVNDASKLRGKRVFVDVIDERVGLEEKWKGSEPGEPGAAFAYRKMTPDATEAWKEERNAVKAKTREDDWHVIGVRSGLGSYPVYSLTPPAEWLAQVTALELEGRGARVAKRRGDADVVLVARMRYLRVDIATTFRCRVVVDFEIGAKGKPVRKRTIDANGRFTSAWSTSAFAFYQVVRNAEQRLMWMLFDELERASG